MKTCQHCGENILQKANESNYRYQQKKFCSPEHCRAYMREHHLGWFSGPQKNAPRAKGAWQELDPIQIPDEEGFTEV